MFPLLNFDSRFFKPKFLLMLLCFAFIGLVSFVAHAQDATVTAPSSDEIMAWVTALGGLKGAGTMAIVAIVVQGLMLLFRSKLGDFAGPARLVLVTALTMAGGLVALKVQGMSWTMALVNPATLAAVQVFIHQVYTQFFEKKAAA